MQREARKLIEVLRLNTLAAKQPHGDCLTVPVSAAELPEQGDSWWRSTSRLELARPFGHIEQYLRTNGAEYRLQPF